MSNGEKYIFVFVFINDAAAAPVPKKFPTQRGRYLNLHLNSIVELI